MMRSIKHKLYAAAVIAVAVVGGSCGEVGSPPFAPQADLLSTTALVQPYVLRTVPATAQTAAVVIDSRGGEVKAGGHMLIVPSGAVSEPTTFTMHVLPGTYIQVDLSAALVSNGAAVTTFPVDLRLKLNYRDGVVLNEGRLAVAYLVDGTTLGRRQKMPGWVDAMGKFVDARLSHFSTYAIIVD